MNHSKKLYEVLTYKDGDDPQMPRSRSTWAKKTDAMQIAGSAAKDPANGRVEVNLLYVDSYDENNIYGGDLVASWVNGRKTA